MHEDQIRRLLRSLEDDVGPDPVFADALYQRLNAIAGERSRSHAPLLLAAALLTVIAAGLAVGTGLLPVPELVDADGSAAPSSSAVAIASPSPSPSASQRPAPTVPALPSEAPGVRPTAGSVLSAEADGLRIRSEPSESGELLATLRRGQLMAATGQSRDVDGITWLEVGIGPGELAGWVATGPGDAWLRLVEDGAVTFACSDCGDGSSIVSVNPFGDADITTIAPAGELSEWTWSPDGTRLVGSRGGTTLPYHIVLIGPDGTELADLGIGSGATWSPDGTRLAWLAEQGLVVTDQNLVPRTIDLGGLSGGLPLWSPDGRQFAMNATEDPGIIDPPSALYLVPVVGGEPVRLTVPGYIGGLSWSPDGSMIAYTTVDLSGETLTRAWIMPADGGEPGPLLDGARAFGPPVWSPAGDRLAIATDEGLVLAAGDGTGAAVLVAREPEQFIGEVGWSPSGRWLLYSMSTGREPTLFIVASDGSSQPVAISPEGAGGQQADWQPVLAPLP